MVLGFILGGTKVVHGFKLGGAKNFAINNKKTSYNYSVESKIHESVSHSAVGISHCKVLTKWSYGLL
jgi:hypothetical protein